MTAVDDRALGALMGLAIGDALGMPTQSLTRAEVVSRFGSCLRWFERAPDDQPIAPGMAAGSVTDDTEQAVLLAGVLLDGDGSVDARLLADRLVAWELEMRARGSLDLLGPSTRRAIDALRAGGDLGTVGRSGTTNGAAMRIAPVGIAWVADDLDALVEAVVEASRLTHDTSLALAAAAAVAAAVSAGVQGATVREATDLAVRAAVSGARHGAQVAGADVAARIAWATSLDLEQDVEATADLVGRLVGTSLAAQESVPAAFAVLAARPDDPFAACLLAASLGGDCDTIAAMTGAVAGACHGVDAFPAAARELVERVNALRLEPLAQSLLALRARAGARARAQSTPDDARATVPAERAAPVPLTHGPDGRDRGPARRYVGMVHVGNVVADVVVRIGRLPDAGADVRASSGSVHAGGAFNTMSAAARLGMRVRYGGVVGSGPFADAVFAELVREDIEVVAARVRGRDTGFVVCAVDDTGERTFVTVRGAEVELDPGALAQIGPTPVEVVCLSGYGLVDPRNRSTLLEFVAGLAPGVDVAFDPGPLVGEIPRDALDAVLARVRWLSCNAAEAAALTGGCGPQDAADHLAARLPAAGICVRDAARGCVVASRSLPAVRVPGVAVAAVDTNGAGDVHLGAFLAALGPGPDLVGPARAANVAAAYAVGVAGPAAGPTSDELDRFVAGRSR